MQPYHRNRFKQKSPRQQQGAALIIALVIMTIAVTISANILFRQQLNTRLSSNINNLEQAYLYATGIEDWTRTILARDSEEAPETDNLTEPWATEIPPIPIPGGSMTGRLYDLQALINVNNVYPPENPIPDVDEVVSETVDADNEPLSPEAAAQAREHNRYIIARQRVANMVTVADPDETLGVPINVVDVLQDWIDEDQNTLEGGAESDHYRSQEIPYSTANSRMVSPTELRLLKDIDKDGYKLLRKYFTALPEMTSINVNTAPYEVIQALGFTPEAAENIVSVRDDTPFEALEEFLRLAVVDPAMQPDADGNVQVYGHDISITSSYFLLQGEINIGTARIYINSILHRNDGKVNVISRDFSNQQLLESK